MISQLHNRWSLMSNFERLLMALAFIFCSWLALYLPHLRISPRWYGDEFLTLISGNGILQHTFTDRALRNNFFRTLLNYQPIGTFLFAFFAQTLTDGDILGARLLSICFALLIAFVVCITFARRGKLLVGFSAALTILAAPQCVIHFRWVYPHYFVSLGVIMIGLTLDTPPTKRRDWIIGMGAGIAAMGHLLAIHVTLGALLARIFHTGSSRGAANADADKEGDGLRRRLYVSYCPRSNSKLTLYPSGVRKPQQNQYEICGLARIRLLASWLRIILPPALILSSSLLLGYLSCGKGLFLDLQGLFFFYTIDSNGTHFSEKLMTFWTFFFMDWFHVLLLFSFVGIACARKWALLIFSAFIVVIVIQNRPELSIFYYQAMIFIPLLCVNLILSLDFFLSRLQPMMDALFCSHSHCHYQHKISILVLLLVPCMLLPGSLNNSFSGTLKTLNDYWVAPNCRDLEEAASWINQHTNNNDFVVAYWDSEWLLKCRSTDILQCATWRYGVGSITTYNRSFSREEFLWPADIRQAKYVFVSSIDLRWSYGEGNAPKLIKETKLFSWPIVFRTKTTFVLSNPDFQEQVPTLK